MVSFVRIFADAQGESHVEDLDVGSDPADFAPAPGVDGPVLLAQDATGRGHASHVRGDEECMW